MHSLTQQPWRGVRGIGKQIVILRLTLIYQQIQWVTKI